MADLVFLHGLDSSSHGTKASYFRKHFPAMLVPDFSGPLAERMATLEDILADKSDLTLIGSSFGGLMATLFALAHEELVKRLILLAPALNFPEFSPPASPVATPTLLYIGSRDTVTPPHLVRPAAAKTFRDLTLTVFDDDHLLRQGFHQIHWQQLLAA
ncbi:MAG: alpha/beta fold hydrolase [Thermodesulfobacteriota bacterium]